MRISNSFKLHKLRRDKDPFKVGNVRYPVRVWLGRYQAWMLTLYGKRSFRREAATVEKFFELCPKKFLSQYKPEDIDDYAIGRTREGKAAATVAIELSRIKRFWKWAIQDRGLNLLEPVTTVHRTMRHKANQPHKAKRLSPNELSQLLKRMNEQPELIVKYLHTELGKILEVKASLNPAPLNQCDEYLLSLQDTIGFERGNQLMRQLLSPSE